MKLKINYFLSIIMLAIILAGAYAWLSPQNNAYGYTYKHPVYVSTEYLANYEKDAYDKYYHTTFNGVNIYVDEGVTVEKFNELISYINETNKELLSSATDIYFINQSIYSTFLDYDISYSKETTRIFMGITFHKKNIGKARNEIYIPYYNLAPFVYYHEMWHCYDFAHQFPSHTEEFQTLASDFSNEKNSYEDFAYCGETYSCNPDELKSSQPELYNYYYNLLN